MRALRIALAKWAERDGIAWPIAMALTNLGHYPILFRYDEQIPSGVDLVLTFAPYNRLMPVIDQLCRDVGPERPVYVHWNFESLPNPNLSWFIKNPLARFISWSGRISDPQAQHLIPAKPLLPLRMSKFRYLGEYTYAANHGALTMLADISQENVNFHNRHGIPARYIPWGAPNNWYSNLNLKRDIDVLWMGKRRTKRRSQLLTRVSEQLEKAGRNILLADGIIHPFIHDEVRAEILNRSKITLNLLPTWYDPALIFRFLMAAGNRSLVISEPSVNHAPEIIPGVHYVSTPVEKLEETINYYLDHPTERDDIVESAYRLVVDQMTLAQSVQNLLDTISKYSIPATTERKLSAHPTIQITSEPVITAVTPSGQGAPTLPSIGVIILNWRRPEKTLQCLRTIFQQGYPNLSILVFDNHSGDESTSMLKAAYPSLKVVESETNLGFTGGNNQAIKRLMQEQVDYFLLLNDDAALASGAIRTLVQAAGIYPQAGFLGPIIYSQEDPSIILSAGGRLSTECSAFHRGMGERNSGQFAHVEQMDFLSGSALMIKREIVDKIGYLDDHYYLYFEEVDWCFRGRKAGYQCLLIPEASVYHPDTRTRDENSVYVTYYINRNRLLFIRKHKLGSVKLARVMAGISRQWLSWFIKPKWKLRSLQRQALAQALRDFSLQRYGKWERFETVNEG